MFFQSQFKPTIEYGQINYIFQLVKGVEQEGNKDKALTAKVVDFIVVFMFCIQEPDNFLQKWKQDI